MNPSRPFILRPVATILFMVAILLSGLVAWKLLPVSALPEVDYPTIQVVTYYPGASPEVVASTITTIWPGSSPSSIIVFSPDVAPVLTLTRLTVSLSLIR